MTEYLLYLESGPKHKKTMVHMLDLLGCIAQGPTTEAALEASPEAIRAFLGFLKKHGEAVDTQAPFTTRVAIHITEGTWLANGDPTCGFAPDFEPLAAEDLATYLRWLDWLQADLLELVQNLSFEKLQEEPESGGRSIHHILQHTADSHGVYLRYLVGKVDGLSEALKAVRDAPLEILPPTLTDLWHLTRTRLEALSEAERRQSVPHGQVTWTARRALRRMLEHAWEHRMEISTRLKNPIS
ncbi:MAG TPA: DinB family protein [Anaerolineales bacterium]|nr:DinB family protein [Anaerolineales bacterium]